MWQDVAALIEQHNNFLITTHINPEGDAVGSEVGLALFLQNLGKKTVIVNSSPTPANCLFLPLAGFIKIYPDDYTPDVLENAGVVFILDVNSWQHVGSFGDVIRASSKPRVCIDHHQGPEEGFARVIVSDTKAAAAGLMIFDLINHMGGEITPDIAEALYTAISTDTGSFRFSNTDARVFSAAAELCAKGAKPFSVFKKVNARRWGATRLIGSALATLEKTADGKIAWIHVTQEMFEEAGAEYEDSDGLLELVRPVRGVELCIIFKEVPGGEVKVSMRSNGVVDAFAIAKLHGGGGHRLAAGMAVEGPIQKAIARTIAECVEVVRKTKF
jgi:nanoRNase/pAp phosphatase (c-di-AMP/oligoRNAs hydrolase)